jgi:hypothetical protein
MSFGGTTCANCGLVSMLPRRGRKSITVDHASRKLPRIRTIIPSITDISMSESSRLILADSPFPPKRRSMMVKEMEGSISKIADPFSGSMLITARVVGLGIERINSS